MSDLPTDVQRMIDEKSEIEGLWGETFSDHILALVDVGETEVAKQQCRTRLLEHEDVRDTAYSDMEFTLQTPNFRVTFGAHTDSISSEVIADRSGWAIHKPTDVEFEVDARAFDMELDEAQAKANTARQKDSRGSVAKAVYRRTRL